MLILISGKQGSGKTTIAEMLQVRLGVNDVYMGKFARPIYEMHDAIASICAKYGEGFKIDGALLQMLGTEWGRKHKGEDFWVNLAKKSIPDGKRFAIFDDCRFPNELFAFDNEMLTFKLRLQADERIRYSRMMDKSKWRDGSHESEVALDGFMDSFDLVVRTDYSGSYVPPVREIMAAIEGKLNYAGAEHSPGGV